jgi:hypothetical protein
MATAVLIAVFAVICLESHVQHFLAWGHCPVLLLQSSLNVLTTEDSLQCLVDHPLSPFQIYNILFFFTLSKAFRRLGMTRRITGVLDFVHRPELKH